MRTRNSKGSDAGSGSENDARTSSSRKGGNGGSSGKVRRQTVENKSLVLTAWALVKQVFFTLVHIYKSMTAFWSQMHVCMLPALGELDNEQEQQDQDMAEQDTGASRSPGGSPKQRKRTTKVN